MLQLMVVRTKKRKFRYELGSGEEVEDEEDSGDEDYLPPSRQRKQARRGLLPHTNTVARRQEVAHGFTSIWLIQGQMRAFSF